MLKFGLNYPPQSFLSRPCFDDINGATCLKAKTNAPRSADDGPV